ncbi:MAG: arsenite methyltransferase [Thermoanaerobaculia bacterium]
MISQKSPSEVRDGVTRAYAHAIEKVEPAAGCCGGSDGCGTAGVAAGAAAASGGGYGEDLAGVPGEAAASSFGCGNPLAFAGVDPGDTVLDLGSGAGLDLLIAADKVGPRGRVIGVDMTAAMIAAARRNVEAAGAANVEVRKGVIEELPVADDSVDWVISNCVINLSPEKDRVFAEIFRVLKPGGRFAVSDIVAESLPAWLLQHEAAYAACVSGAISEDAYRRGLAAAGLDQVEVSERLVYDAPQLRAIVASDLDNLGLASEIVERGIAEVAGKVWSAKFKGRKPLPA